MRTIDQRAQSPDALLALLERAVEQLHARARQDASPRDFYSQLIEQAVDLLAAGGGAAWSAGDHAGIELICQTTNRRQADSPPELSARRRIVMQAAAAATPIVQSVGRDGSRQPSAADVLVVPVLDAAPAAGPPPADAEPPAVVVACLELWMPLGGGGMARQGWLDVLGALADVAADFHAFAALRRLRAADALRSQAIDLMRRVSRPRDLTSVAYEAANEGRRALDCDRLSVLVRRGGRLKLLAVSGVDALPRRSDFVRRMRRLAEQASRWGEPFEYSTHMRPAAPGGGPAGLNGDATALSGPPHDDQQRVADADDLDLPPQLAAALDEQLDHSQARTLAWAPVSFPPLDPRKRDLNWPRRGLAPADAVFIAERFAGGGSALGDALVELAELCGPMLARTAQLERFPVATLLRWSDRWARWRAPGLLFKRLLWLAAVAGAAAALALVPCAYNVEAPAILHAAVERDLFATATGSVVEVRVKHGQQVAPGDVAVVLDDPDLALQQQQIAGQIDAVRKRLEALALARTERQAREGAGSDDRLPLSAEQQQLAEQLASLRRQRELLEARRTALVIRSPIAGTVLTRDVHTLLESRPVERGQVLLTVADAAQGWELEAALPQRRVGIVLAAQRASDEPLAVSYRLASDVEASHAGRLVETSSAALLDAEQLRNDAPPVQARIETSGPVPSDARPGMSAVVQIHCGQKPVGYVWLHDAAATVYRWITF